MVWHNWLPILFFCLLEYLFIEKNSLLISLRWDWYSKYIKQIFFSSGFWNIHKIGCWKFVVFHVTPWRLVRVTTVFSHKFFKSYSITLKLSFFITKYSHGWNKHKVRCVHQPMALRNWIKMHMFDKKNTKIQCLCKTVFK